MKRNIRLEDIWDGNLYTANDMVKADCLWTNRDRTGGFSFVLCRVL